MGKAVPSLFLPFAELLDRERLRDFFWLNTVKSGQEVECNKLFDVCRSARGDPEPYWEAVLPGSAQCARLQNPPRHGANSQGRTLCRTVLERLAGIGTFLDVVSLL
jgi:hypothetical protein